MTEDTKEVTVQATDGLGNIADTKFVIDQIIPSISYQSVSRTDKSIWVKGLRVENFPDREGVRVTYSWDGRNQILNLSSDHEIPDVDESWIGTIVASATDADREFFAECHIPVNGKHRLESIGVWYKMDIRTYFNMSKN